jgi:hypothetical protein
MKPIQPPIDLDELDAGHPLRQVPFTAPDGYFDRLPGRLQAKITATKPEPAFQVGWSWSQTAASLAGIGLVAVLVWQTLPQRQESLGSSALAGVSSEAIAVYLDEQGVNPVDMTDPTMVQQSLGSDSATIRYLNVNPADIRQHIERQTLPDNLDQGS